MDGVSLYMCLKVMRSEWRVCICLSFQGAGGCARLGRSREPTVIPAMPAPLTGIEKQLHQVCTEVGAVVASV